MQAFYSYFMKFCLDLNSYRMSGHEREEKAVVSIS